MFDTGLCLFHYVSLLIGNAVWRIKIVSIVVICIHADDLTDCNGL